jgi:excisionase family DNA binding protein
MQPITSVDRIARTTTCPWATRPTRAEVAEHHPSPLLNARSERNMASMAAQQLGPMLTASEVAELLHLHVNTVKRLGDRGELPFYRVCKRGDRRFRLDDVLTFLAVNR